MCEQRRRNTEPQVTPATHLEHIHGASARRDRTSAKRQRREAHDNGGRLHSRQQHQSTGMDTLWVGRIYLAACHSKQRMFIRSSKCWPASLILRAKLAHTAHQLMYIFACPLSRLSRLVARRLPIVCVSASKRCPAVVRAFTFCSLDAMSKVEEEVAAAPAAPTTSADAPNHASWQQTMLRVKDPEVEVPFWQYVSVVSTDRCALSCGTVVLMTSRKMFGAQDQLWLRACGPP